MNNMNKDELKEKVADYASKVFFYCVKRCNSRMDAEDLSQTVLLEIIQNIDKGARKVSGYLTTDELSFLKTLKIRESKVWSYNN